MALERILAPSRATRWLVALAVSIVAAGPRIARAHDVAPDPVVNLVASLEATILTLRARVPLAVLTGAGLPLDGPQLAPDTPQSSLDLVGRDLAASLELSQGDRTLAAASIRSAVAADRTSVDVELVYGIDPSDEPVTARLPPYTMGGVPIPTAVRYENPPAPPRTFAVTTEAERVAFDPAFAQVLRRFAARAVTELASVGDFLILALCLIVPGRKPGALVRASIALLVGEVLTIPAAGADAVALTPALTPFVHVLAGLVIVATALARVVNPASRWLTPLAFLFGLAHGLDVGAVFAADSGLAGAHAGVGLLGFLAVTLVGQVWILALLSSALGLLLQWGLPQRIALFGLVAVAAHAALHRLADGTRALATATDGSPDRYGVAIVLATCTALLCAGIAERLWFPSDSSGALVPADHASNATAP